MTLTRHPRLCPSRCKDGPQQQWRSWSASLIFGVETISEESFYDGFFSLLQQYLNEKPW